MKATKLNVKEVEKIQIDHGLIYLDYGETSQRLLSPTRGGGEFVATVTVRDIEFDGRNGKVAGMQVIEENAATLKTTLLGMTQENLRLEIPGAKVANSPEAAAALAQGRAFVIGGASVYRQMLPWCTQVYVTKIDACPQSDVFFPNLDADPRWRCADAGQTAWENGVAYRFCRYVPAE